MKGSGNGAIVGYHTCGGPIFGSERFCTTCGNRIEAGSVTSVSPSGGEGTCPKCGGPIFGNERFCTSCGHVLSGDTSAPGLGGASDPDVVGWCKKCSGPLYRGDKFCVACREPVPDPYDSGAGRGTEPPGHRWREKGSYDPTIDFKGGDEILVRPELVFLSREEARHGCRKSIDVDGQIVTVDVDPGTNESTTKDIPGLGYRDERTGEVGPLRVEFMIS